MTRRWWRSGIIGLAVVAVMSLSVALKADQGDLPLNTPRFATEDVKLTIEPSPKMLAEEPEPHWDQRTGDNWFYQSYMTLWAASMNGTVGKNETEVDIDVSFSDILD